MVIKYAYGRSPSSKMRIKEKVKGRLAILIDSIDPLLSEGLNKDELKLARRWDWMNISHLESPPLEASILNDSDHLLVIIFRDEKMKVYKIPLSKVPSF